MDYTAMTKTSKLIFVKGLILYLVLNFQSALSFDAIYPESGVWQSAEGGGRGYSIEIQNGEVFVLVYTYDEEGEAIWLLAFGDFVPLDFQVTGQIGHMTAPLFTASDGQCIGCDYTPHNEDPSFYGDLVITFTSSHQALIEIGLDEQILIQRFTWSWNTLAEQLAGTWALTDSDGFTWFINIVDELNDDDTYDIEDMDGHLLGDLTLSESGEPQLHIEGHDGSPFEIYSTEVNRFFGRTVSGDQNQDFTAGNILAVRMDAGFSTAISQAQEPADAAPKNILLIIADDMGLDSTPGYSEGLVKPSMPNIEALAGDGLVFENVWSAPVCSPTRATILTGKYGFRTGVVGVGDELSTTEVSLQSLLDSESVAGYSHAVIGKWHLSNQDDHPQDMGIGYFAGIINGGVNSYYSWNLSVNGDTFQSNEYTTTKLTDLAIDWVSDQQSPWFLWLAYNAPHTPFHVPPDDLHSQGNLSNQEEDIEAEPLPYYLAALEAMDSEIGRLLGSLTDDQRENTTIIFIGDNGTPGGVAQSPYVARKSKGSLYQGGVNVPMIVAGPGVARAGDREDALINSTDLFATIADLAATGISTFDDSISFRPLLTGHSSELREYVYAEVSENNRPGYAVRDDQYKLIVFENSGEEMYDLSVDPYESTDLLDEPLSNPAAAAKERLENHVSTMLN